MRESVKVDGGLASPAGSASSSLRQAPFKVSVMLWTLGIDRPVDQRLEEVAQAGYRAVELAGEYATWSEDDFRRYNDKRRELGITFDSTASAMAAPGRARHNASDPSQREDFLADVRAELKQMEKIQCPGMIVMAGDLVPGLSPRTQRESCVEALKRAGELAEGQGVTVLLENVDLEENPDYLARSAADTFQLVADVDHPQVKVCYDLFHAQISGGNLIANLERYIDLVGKIHIGDVPGHHEPGTGEINFANIYKKLAELEYDGYVAMEFLPTGDRVATIARAREAALQAPNIQ
ncbi:MAG TPA: TIM barrel protein [Solirubrobacteraceae bacterium]|nr:TIM barrel protein [Solirubrobacteraceae bacterium]